MEVKFKLPHLYKGADPHKVYEELQTLGDNVKPADIVEAAKNTDSELHKCFEWDDTEAARKYRLQQARVLVGSLVIIETKQDVEPQQIRVMYTSKDGGYKPTRLIVHNQNEYEHLLEKAKAELHTFKQKYSMLVELHEIIALID